MSFNFPHGIINFAGLDKVESLVTFIHPHFIIHIRGVDSFLNPGRGAGSSLKGIISFPGLNRVY